jgi:hypothetical protein
LETKRTVKRLCRRSIRRTRWGAKTGFSTTLTPPPILYYNVVQKGLSKIKSANSLIPCQNKKASLRQPPTLIFLVDALSACAVLIKINYYNIAKI